MRKGMKPTGEWNNSKREGSKERREEGRKKERQGNEKKKN